MKYYKAHFGELTEKQRSVTTCGGIQAAKLMYELMYVKDGKPKELMKIFVTAEQKGAKITNKQYVISYRGDFNLRETKTMINSFEAVDFLCYKNSKIGLSIRYPSDWKKEEKDYFAEINRFTEVVRFYYYNSEDQGFFAIHVRNSNNIAFAKYIYNYIRSLRMKFLSSIYIVNESDSSPCFDDLLVEIPNSSQKEIVYRLVSLIRGELEITEKVALIYDRAYHIYTWKTEEETLLPIINNMINSLSITYRGSRYRWRNTYVYAWNNEGLALEASKKHEEAIKCYDEVLKIDRKNVFVLINKGLALIDLEKYEEAIKCYDKVSKISHLAFDIFGDPENADAWRNKYVYALNRAGEVWTKADRSKAIKCYDKALEIDPKNADAWGNKGLAFIDWAGQHEEAIRCYDKALEIDPKNADAWRNKYVHAWHEAAQLYIRGNSYDEAIIKIYDKALKIDPKNVSVLMEKGYALNILGKYNEAIECCDKALEIDPKDVDVWNSKGVVLGNLGKYNEAIECFNKALEIDPRYALAIENRDIVLERMEK